MRERPVKMISGRGRGRGEARLRWLVVAVVLTALVPGLAHSPAQAAPAPPAAQAPARAAKHGKPGAPALYDIYGDAHSLVIDYFAPRSDGGHKIRRYEATLNGGKTWKKIAHEDGGEDDLVGRLNNLKINKRYKVAVRAVNKAGHSKKSKTRSIIAVSAPSKPRSVKVVPDGSGVTVTWKAPKSDGGRPVLSYDVVAANDVKDLYAVCDNPVPDGAARSCTITGLVSGESYVLRMLASNYVEQPYDESPQIVGDGDSDFTTDLPFTAP